MTQSPSRIVQCAINQLHQDQKKLSYSSLSVELVLQHQSKCEHWKNIESASLVKYVYYCLHTLKMIDLRCETIVILQQYLSISGHVYPENEAALANFYHTGRVPYANLKGLNTRAVEDENGVICAMCFRLLEQGRSAVRLSCGHYCCSPTTNTLCDVTQWLAFTNTCPQCKQILRTPTT